MYEKYTHYVPGDSPKLKRFVLDLVTGYCNLCDTVIAPSQSVAKILREREVTAPIKVIPTGIDIQTFATGDGNAFRKKLGIPQDAFVVGHVGRLAPEKNLPFLAAAVSRFLKTTSHAHFLLTGSGPSKSTIEETFRQNSVFSRLHLAGVMPHKDLADAYHAMDVFTFSSQTETQGMVLAEAMAAGVPVVAIDASGVREVVRDGENGRLLPDEDLEAFAAGLSWIADLGDTKREALSKTALATARQFSMPLTASRTLELYASLIEQAPEPKEIETSPWALARRQIEEEWKILRNIVHAAGEAVLSLGANK
jgi:glycosyltransferase involved in cell wall biosynthesis